MTRRELKALLWSHDWAALKKDFPDFEPQFTDYKGTAYFNWRCLTPEMSLLFAPAPPKPKKWKNMWLARDMKRKAKSLGLPRPTTAELRAARKAAPNYGSPVYGPDAGKLPVSIQRQRQISISPLFNKLPHAERHKLHANLWAVSYCKQEGFCYYCEKLVEYKDWTLDHKTPLSRGGSDHEDNKVGCCWQCNHLKSNLTEEEFKGTTSENRKALLRTVNKKQVDR